ncbi:TetR family transcriptional regulator [Gordonia sp. PDNC005]|uniref:TetR/AcrR family transcriptional regulator n=1 Tax=Gordonia sp. PDNC005 TaxID=2811424 RepID=UPI001965EE3F|nr:TetR family transcriptional regulator [Gordonia sp. PDNC005]QRY63492.1 TetR family transcriptional regulator [Gordonia sp. PDNC005]
MEKSTRIQMLEAGLTLLGEVGFRGWSMRRVEDTTGVPHGSARHHFSDQRGLVLAMVRHLLAVDLPRADETPTQQVSRWTGSELAYTRARYELIVAAFHDRELTDELVRGRDQLVAVLQARGMTKPDAAGLATALDGMILDAVLRRTPPDEIETQAVVNRFLQ